MGIIIRNVDISSGEITVNLNEGLFVKKKKSLESPSRSDRSITGSNVDSVSTNQPSKKQQILAGFSPLFPEKV